MTVGGLAGGRVEVTADEARRMALWAQGLLGAPYGSGVAQAGHRRQTRAVGEVLRHLGAVQLDTISVLARSHELVAYARLGSIDRVAIESAYWSGDTAFEYWSHAASILPVEQWPWFTFRRRHYARRGQRWHDLSPAAVAEVRRRLEIDGPLMTGDLGGARRSAEWWDWSESKVAVEWLLDIGEVVCTRRIGWRRVYDLPERALGGVVAPQSDWVEVDGVVGPEDAACLRHLIAGAGRSLGVGTAADIADVHRLKTGDVLRHVEDTDLVAVQVAGWGQPAWAAPEALEWLARGGRGRHRTTLLSPFDSLIWNRDRTERIFGMAHRLEAYTPAAKRVHGYFAMPVLHGGRLLARVDPAREGATLVARRITFQTDARGRPVADAVEGTRLALAEAASWVGADAVRIDDVPARASERI